MTLEKAVVVFSGGLDSVCTCAFLESRYQLYGISFSYGQRANREIIMSKRLAKTVGLKEHKIVDIGFMKSLYGRTNVLTDAKQNIPKEFGYSIVVPVRNAVFLSIASAWAYSLNASLVAYGAHTGDAGYPDCRPEFAEKLQDALNHGELDGIKSGLRGKIEIWSPFIEGLSKSDLLKTGHERYKDAIFDTWSCYTDKEIHCGECESCNNRNAAFKKAGIADSTKYLN